MSSPLSTPRDAFFKSLDEALFYLFIFAFSYLFVYTIPWVELFGEDWVDVGRYLFRIEYLERGGEEREYTGFSILFSEFIWKGILLAIAAFYADHRDGIYLVSYVSLLLYSVFTFRRINILLAIVFFFNPMFVDLIMGQNRMALAFPVLLLAYSVRQRATLAWSLLVVAVFIHTGTLIFIVIYFTLKYFEKRLAYKKLYLTAMSLGIFIALMLKYAVIALLAVVGDRRANNDGGVDTSSLLFSFPWLIIVFMFLWKGETDKEEGRIVIGFSIVTMVLLFVTSALNVYGQRFVAVSIPLIVIAISYLPKHFRHWTWGYLFLYQFLQWKYRAVYTIL